MLSTTTRLDRMEGRMTLEKLAVMMAGGFAEITARFDVLEKHVGGLEGDMQNVKDRLGRLEYAVYEIQKDFMSFDQVRGVHKTLDNMDGRISTLEHRNRAKPAFFLKKLSLPDPHPNVAAFNL
jgi:hypothetical protein